MQSCEDNICKQKLVFRPRRLMGVVSKGVEFTHLLQALWQVNKLRNMGSQKCEVMERKRGRNVIRGVTGLRKRAGRRSRYFYSHGSVKGTDQNHNHNQSMNIYRRLKKLQRLIPGGKKMDVDVLFQETAEYILSLKMQVHLLQTLSNIWSTNNNVPHQALGKSEQFS